MRKKNITLFLFFCVLNILLVVGVKGFIEWKNDELPITYTDKVLGVAVVSDTDFLNDKKKLQSDRNPGICFEEVLLPYDLRGICYLPQDMEKDWVGKLTTSEAYSDEYFLCMPQDVYLERKADAIRENHYFTLWMVGDDNYYEVQLVVTGMPVIAMETERQEEPEEFDYYEDPDRWTFDRDFMCYGKINVFNPGVGTKQYEIVESHVCYHEKGGITKGFLKRSYSISLQNEKGQNIDVSLLGMRADNMWKLNSLVTDPNKIREKTAAQIWEQFDMANETVTEAGPREEYVELIIDNQYRGLYCLVEPVDSDKLKLDRNDVLYKTYGEKPTTDFDYEQVSVAGWKMTDTVRLRYPEENIDYVTAWYPMRDYTNTFMWSEMADGESVNRKLNLGNICDNYMFLMACGGSDNQYKNNYYAARVNYPGDYTMYRVPWDVDLTFGNVFDLESGTKSYFEEDYTVTYSMEEWDAIYESNPDEVYIFLSDRWKKYRETFLRTENINGLLIENRDYIVNSGAAQREQECWPESEFSMDIDSLLDYQSKRMEWLDSFFG